MSSFYPCLRTKRQKKRLVRDLTKALADTICKQIDAGKVPVDWDGHELRRLLADKFEWEVTGLLKKGRRLKDYRNAVIINNL